MKKIVLFIFISTSLLPDLALAQFDSLEERLTPREPQVQTRSASLPPETIEAWRATFSVDRSNLLRQESSYAAYQNYAFGLPGEARKKETYPFDLSRIYEWVKRQAADINQKPVSAELEIKDGKAVKFVNSSTGVEVDVLDSTLKTAAALEKGGTEAVLVVRTTQPEKTLAQTNNLGIRELVSVGTSSFAGSPANRIHNVKLGVSHISGVIVPPGATFSFNDNVGEISATTGYKEALVIKRTGTVPEAGGGMCQVSSTVFRGVMNGGMKVTTRRNHAYSVQYYNPPGTDATTYNPTQDFKFVNDTPGSLLIWAEYPTKSTLVFKFYGTKDDRVVKVNTPISYDKKPDGSLKAEWSRTVTLNGKTREDVFKSVYLSPNLFHKHEEEGKVGPNGLLLTPVENTSTIKPAPTTPATSTPTPLDSTPTNSAPTTP
ncbi:MAG TPA: VanW family protein [Patescibacteria group bacterium]|nr:VanW family protein [Patescibacteria group bacterium]